MLPTVEWRQGAVRILDQSRLPAQVEFLECRDYQAVGRAITELRVRGAPAIGVTAALGVALGAEAVECTSFDEFRAAVGKVCDYLAGTRPTAVNLFWALERMKRTLSCMNGSSVSDCKKALLAEALRMVEEDVAVNMAIGHHGAVLIEDGATVLTHCNAGALATAGYGTALGVVRAAWEQGKRIEVVADETRPVLQGARLTAWELLQDGIPVTLITDNMAGTLMRQGRIQLCIVGADRIAANGDVANKIGTYSVAVLANAHGIPFYVAAPFSTVDPRTPSGEGIPIEERRPEEVLSVFGGPTIAPAGVKVFNPAFDVTPARYITGIITERGIFSPSELSHHLSGPHSPRLGDPA